MSYTITSLRDEPISMDWGVIDRWGVVIAQFDRWDDAQMFRTIKDNPATSSPCNLLTNQKVKP